MRACKFSSKFSKRLKYAACGSMKIRDAKNYGKNRHLHTIAQLGGAIYLQLRHVWAIGKKSLNSSISFTCPHNMMNFDSLTDEINW